MDVNDVTFLGCYFLTSRTLKNSKLNECFLIYKISGIHDEADDTVYYFTRFDNIVILEDGTCSVDLDSYSVPSTHVGWSFYVYGYETPEALFSTCVTANVENYSYESSVSEE